MKLKTLNNVEEGELFFAYVDTQDGKDLRSFIKCKHDLNLSVYHFVCDEANGNGDEWHKKSFNRYDQVWA